jgi:hypothetical protein
VSGRARQSYVAASPAIDKADLAKTPKSGSFGDVELF